MQRIEVKNFGPLKDITLDIKDYMVFIGPQASGKSTLAKLIYFFWEVRKEYRSTIAPTLALNKFLKNEDEEYHWSRQLISYVRDLFLKRFTLFRNGKVIFLFDINYKIEIDVVLLTEGLENDVKVSKAFFDELKSFESKIDYLFPKRDPLTSDREITFEKLYKLITTQLLDTDSYVFFNTKHKRVDTFIPAGRMLISIFSNSISFIENNRLDFYNEEFIKLANKIRDFIKSPDYENSFGWSARLNPENNLEDIYIIATKLAFNILKGDFYLDNSGDGIMHYGESNHGYLIPLKNTSSGQQEASWLINTIQYLLAGSLNKVDTIYSTVVEEPETHLFPEAQRDITYLITLLANQPIGQVIITTHSPYILATLNNLIEAYIVGREAGKKEAVSKLIDPLLWINPENIFVGYIDKGKVEDIVDPETHLIKHEILDGVSVDIMSKFDDLLEIQYDK